MSQLATMQPLKINPSLLDQIVVSNERITAQITLMNDEPTQYTGETLKHALRVIAWHCEEQTHLIDTLRGYVRKINALIDDADKVLQGGFKAGQAEKLQGDDFDNWIITNPAVEVFEQAKGQGGR